ncbi:MAG: pilus assembly PilX family protein [Caldicoprobacterales bacterium]
MIKNNRGSALVTAVIVMLVMSILGVTLLQLSLAQTRHSIRDKNRMQAYYLARSGVEATIAWMMDPHNNGSALIGKSSADTQLTGSDVDGTFNVEVIGDASETLLIKGTGLVNNVSATAVMAVKKAASDVPVFEDTIYADTIVTLTGNTTIDGTVSAGVEVIQKGNTTITGGDPQIKQRTLPLPIFPSDPLSASDKAFNNSYELDLTTEPNQTKTFKDLELKGGNSKLTIKTGGPGNTVNLVVNNLNLSNGEVVLSGSGRLNIFVKSQVTLDVDVNHDHNPMQLILFVGDGTSPSFIHYSGNSNFNGLIYAPDAVYSHTGNGQITGAVISGTAELKGTPFAEHDYDFDDITFDDLPVALYTRGSWVNN